MLRAMVATLALVGLGCAVGSPAYRACAPGNPKACMQAGAELDHEGSQDFAFRSYATACDDGVLEGCLAAIAAQPNAFSDMTIVEGRYAEVRAKACDLGSDEQCLAGRWPAQARELELVCRRTPATCDKVLRKMDEGTCCVGNDQERAASQAAVSPLGSELAWIGCEAANGVCVPAGRHKWLDTAMRIRLYAHACEAKDGAACTEQAKLLPDEDSQVRGLYMRACQLDDRDGCTELGRLLR